MVEGGVDFAVNYSPAATVLLQAGRIDVDLLKVPDWPELIREARAFRQVYVHFPLEAGNAAPMPDLEAVARLREETGTAFVNLHAAPSGERFPAMEVTTTSAADRLAVTRALVEDVTLACERFGADNVILENLIYRGPDRSLPRPGVEGAVLRDVVEETGCGFLLDLSHARISAGYLGMAPWEYLDTMPVERLRELHVTGIAIVEGRPQDHLELDEADWEAFDGALQRIAAGRWRAPEVVAFEYGGVRPVFEWRSDPRVLEEQVPRLADAVRALS